MASEKSSFSVSKTVKVVTAVAVLLIATIFVFLPMAMNRIGSWSKPVITSTTITNSFNEIAELATEEYNFTGVGKFSDDGYQILGLNVPFTGKSFLVTFSGRVTAGLKNLEAVNVDVDNDKHTVTLRVPHAQVLDAKIDPATIEQYDQSFNPINQFSVQDIADFLDTETTKAKKTAVDGGLIDRADKRLKSLLTAQTDAVLAGNNADSEPWKITVTH